MLDFCQIFQGVLIIFEEALSCAVNSICPVSQLNQYIFAQADVRIQVFTVDIFNFAFN